MTRTASKRLVMPLLVALATVATTPSFAHDARPLSIAVIGQTESVFRAVVRMPPTVEAQNAPSVAWPDRCTVLESTPLGSDTASTSLLRCPDGLESGTIRIDYPYYNPSITTLVSIQADSGPPITAVLPPDQLSWQVPPEPTFAAVAQDYLVLGVRHIWEGIDHLLFVAGLLLLARRPRKVFWAITGFTAAHSLTLGLAALAILRLPVPAVEAMIAMSILFLAGEIARNDATSFSHRYPIALSFVFGLLHGFGFASALGEIGLPRVELAAGLLFFNLGVEVGQLLFITAIAAAWLAAMRIARRVRAIHRPTADRAALVGAYCIGVPGAFWFIERTAAAFVA